MQVQAFDMEDSGEAFDDDICAGCRQDVSLQSAGVIICPDCLVGRYCSDNCERNGREEHKIRCQKLAIWKLAMITQVILAHWDHYHTWEEAVRQSLYVQHVLPDCCTETQLDELSVLWPAVYSLIDADPYVVYKVLLLAIRYACLVQRPAVRMERLIRDSCQMIKAIPPASDEEGAKMWGSNPVFALCMAVGELMSSAGRPRDAANFIHSVKPNLEVALMLEMPRPPQGDGSGPLYTLVQIYRTYARWLKECIPTTLPRAEYAAHPDRQKRIELLKQAMKLGKGLKETLAGCGFALGEEHLEVDDFEPALLVFQKCLKLPWNEWSGRIAARAVDCHILAGRDTPAGKWIDQFLRLEQHCPGQLCPVDQALLLMRRALLVRRRGLHQEGLCHYMEAERILGQAKQDKVDRPEIDEILIELSMDCVDCLDAVGYGGDRVGVYVQHMNHVGIGRSLDNLRDMQRLVDKGQEDEARAKLEDFNLQMLIERGFNHWGWRMKGITLWGMEMLQKWEGLVMQLLPEGEKRTTILAKIEEMRGMEETMKQKLLEDRRAQAMVEVREQVTGKPAAKEEDVLELAGEAAVEGEGSVEATDETPGDRKPSKAARKKRKKRQKKAAQAQEDSSSQQDPEAGLEEGMAGLDMSQEDGDAFAGEKHVGSLASEKEECAICLNELGGEEARDDEGLPCGHVLHASCLGRWVSKCESLGIDTTCPVCRGPLKACG